MINIMTMPYMAIDSTIPTNMNTFDWSAGFSLMTARPAEPTICQIKQRIKFILGTLEEREREEFAKLKKVKEAMEKRK